MNASGFPPDNSAPPATASPGETEAPPGSLLTGAAPEEAVGPRRYLPETLTRSLRWGGHFLSVLLLLVLGGLSASAPIRHSDIWQHLATGRLLAAGSYSFGSDPFAYGAADTYLVNHHWLYDLLVYGIYLLGGGMALGAFKTFLGVALAGVLLWTPGAGVRLWPRLLASALALTALAPGWVLRPICLSYLLLALLLCLLEHARPARVGEAFVSWRVLFGLLPLMALWVNLDSWFLLGLAALLLYGIGELLETYRSGLWDGNTLSRWARRWGTIGLASLAVGLLNPYGIRVFEIPPQLGLTPAARLLSQDPFLGSPRLSPFTLAYWQGPGWSVAGLTYALLILLGLLSGLFLPLWRWPQLLLALTCLLLSFYTYTLIPFFALVMGPLLAGQLQGSRREQQLGPPHPLVPAVSFLGCLGLAAAAWPGWLTAGPTEPRRWVLDTDPALWQTAEDLARWRREGKLHPEDRGLNLTADPVHVLAWLCPQEQGFFSAPWGLSRAAAAQCLQAHQSLLRMPGEPGAEDWRTIFRTWKINHVIVYAPRRPLLVARLFHRLLQEESEWQLLALHGQAAVFGWQDPADPAARQRFVGWRPSAEQLAFASPAPEQAPPHGPDHLPGATPWWRAFVQPAIVWHPDREEAAFHRQHFEVRRAQELRRLYRRYVLCQATRTLAGPATTLLLPPSPSVILSSALEPLADLQLSGPAYAASQQQLFLLAHEEGPPALLYLALRAARRSLRTDPDDPTAQLLLANAYSGLMQFTREGLWSEHFPLFKHLRTLVRAAALQAAVRLQPQLVEAHLQLASLYQRERALDLALDHWRKARQYLEAAGPAPGMSVEQFTQELEKWDKVISQLQETVERRREQYDLRSSDKSIYQRAQLAISLDLSGLALEVLLASDYAAFGDEGMRLELGLLLLAGRLAEMHTFLQPWQEEKLGSTDYRVFRAMLALAEGDYAEAQAQLAEVPVGHTIVPQLGEKKLSLPTAAAALVGLALLEKSSCLGPALPLIAGRDLSETLLGLAVEQHRQALFLLIRGMLALEAGDTPQARQLLRRAQQLWENLTVPPVLAEEAQAGRSLARYGLELLASGQQASQQP